jgi:hypothetical protein
MVDVMQPHIGMTICEPARRTGGVLLAAFDYMRRQSDDKGAPGAARGDEHAPARHRRDRKPIIEGEAQAADPGRRWDMVLTNPFGSSALARAAYAP